MRILVISSLFSPYGIGGAEEVARQLSFEFARKGHDVCVVTTGPVGWLGRKVVIERPTSNMVVHRIPSFNSWWIHEARNGEPNRIRRAIWRTLNYSNPVMIQKVIGIARRFRPDVIHTHNLEGLGGSIWKPLHTLAPVVHTTHDFRIVCARRSLLKQGGELCRHESHICRMHRAVWKRYARYITVLVAPSEFLQAHHAPVLEQTSQRVIRNPIRVPPLGKKAGGVRILYVGRLSEHKGSRVLKQVMEACRTRTSWRFSIVGDGPELPAISKMATGIQNVVVHGRLDDVEKQRELEAASVFLFPSQWPENAPMVLLEALAMGNAVVASRSGGVPEIARHGEEALLINDPTNANEFIEALCQLEENPQLLDCLMQNARRRAQTFDFNQVCSEYEALFHELAGLHLSMDGQ